jgi:hypothetical protein
LHRIFDMFTRVGQEAKNTNSGLGIGLNLAHRLVGMYEGELVATSEGLRKGSHFLITLPLADPAAAETTPHQALPCGRNESRPVRVLIVDDNVDAAASLSLLLL